MKPELLAGLIRQYLAGELNDKAMHDLERQALDDPFLAEALEGYAQHPPEQQTQQADLDFRLAARVAPQEKKVYNMYYRRVAAAAILLLMFSAGWFLWHQQQSAVPIAGVIPPPVPAADTTPQQEKETPRVLANADHLPKKIAPQVPADPQAYKLKEQQAELRAPDAAASAIAPAPVTENSFSRAALAKTSAYALPPVDSMAAETSKQRAQGNVIRRELNTEPGRRFKKQNNGSNVDSQQKPSLNEAEGVGYGATQTKSAASAVVAMRDLSTVPADSNKLQQIYRKVGDVSVDKNGITKKEVAYSAPSPVTGETAFENYLRTKTINPENKYSGTVRVSFTVMPDGSLQDFKILHHLNKTCDAEAIRVIREGPAWIPASDGKPANVKVKVKFTAKKD